MNNPTDKKALPNTSSLGTKQQRAKRDTECLNPAKLRLRGQDRKLRFAVNKAPTFRIIGRKRSYLQNKKKLKMLDPSTKMKINVNSLTKVKNDVTTAPVQSPVRNTNRIKILRVQSRNSVIRHTDNIYNFAKDAVQSRTLPANVMSVPSNSRKAANISNEPSVADLNYSTKPRGRRRKIITEDMNKHYLEAIESVVSDETLTSGRTSLSTSEKVDSISETSKNTSAKGSSLNVTFANTSINPCKSTEKSVVCRTKKNKLNKSCLSVELPQTASNFSSKNIDDTSPSPFKKRRVGNQFQSDRSSDKSSISIKETSNNKNNIKGTPDKVDFINVKIENVKIENTSVKFNPTETTSENVNHVDSYKSSENMQDLVNSGVCRLNKNKINDSHIDVQLPQISNVNSTITPPPKKRSWNQVRSNLHSDKDTSRPSTSGIKGNNKEVLPVQKDLKSFDDRLNNTTEFMVTHSSTPKQQPEIISKQQTDQSRTNLSESLCNNKIQADCDDIIRTNYLGLHIKDSPGSSIISRHSNTTKGSLDAKLSNFNASKALQKTNSVKSEITNSVTTPKQQSSIKSKASVTSDKEDVITNKVRTQKSCSIASTSTSIFSKNKDKNICDNTSTKNINKQNRIPIFKYNALPVIKLTQGDDSSEKRQVGFASDVESLNSFGARYSSCNSQTSVEEDFTAFIAENEYEWSEMYEFDNIETLKISSDDHLFKNAKLSDKTACTENTSPKSTSSSSSKSNSTLSSSSIPYFTQKVFTVSNNVANSTVDIEPLDVHINENNSQRTTKSALTSSTGTRSINSDNSQTSSEKSGERNNQRKLTQFKVPVLPPAKRPPGRAKSNASSSQSSTSIGSVSLSSKSNTLKSQTSLPIAISNSLQDILDEDEDDAISIYAESFKSDREFLDYKPLSRKAQNALLKVPTPIQKKTICISPVKEIGTNDEFDNTFNQNNDSQIIENPIPLMDIPVPMQPPAANLPNNDVARWTSTGHYSTVKHKPDFATIPPVFKLLCYYYFTFGTCRFDPCRRPHTVTDAIQKRLLVLALDDLKFAYGFATDRYYLYCATFHYFVECFQRYRQFKLDTIVDDVFKLIDDKEDRLPYIQKIITSMEAQGQSFTDVIWDILFREGSKNMQLVKILLHIVCNRRQVLINNWDFVKRLFKYYNQNNIHFKLVQEMIDHCINSKNSELCKNVINDIIVCYKVNLDAMNISAINNFYALLHSLELVSEAEIFKQKLNALNIYPPAFQLNPPTVKSHNSSSPAMLSESTLNLINIIASDPKKVAEFLSYSKQGSTSTIISTGQPKPLNSPGYLNREAGDLTASERSSPDIFACHQNANMSKNNQPYVNNDFRIPKTNDQLSNKPRGESLLAFSPLSAANKSASDTGNANIYQFPTSANSSPANTEHLQNGLFNIHSKSTSPLSFNKLNYKPQIQTPPASPILNSRGFINPVQNLQNSPSFAEQYGIAEKQLSADDVDVAKLKEVINKKASYEEFITMLNRYRNTPYKKSFLLHTLCLFKNNKPEQTSYLFKNITKEIKMTFPNDVELKHIMRELCVNLLGILEQQHAFDEAADILVTYYDDLNALINTNWLSSLHNYNSYSSIGKYFFFCRIFTKGGHYKLAYNLFTSQELKLLQGPQLWTLENYQDTDVQFRNKILLDFIMFTLKNNLVIAMDILLHMLTEKHCVTEITIAKHYNTLIWKMVDCTNLYVNELKNMLPNILQGWHRILTDPVLRGLLVTLIPHIPLRDLEYLYEKCRVRNIYPRIMVQERRILLQTGMTCEEIYVIFAIYLNRLLKRKYPEVGDFVFEIQITPPESASPKVLFDNSSIKQLKNRVCTVLAKAFDYNINVPPVDDQPYIRIEREEMRAFLNKYAQRNVRETLTNNIE